LDQSYRSIVRSSEETQLSAAVERAGAANVRVVQPADAPLTGKNPAMIVMACGVALGILAAIAVFALLNATRQIFVSVHDVERQLDLPVLLAVPFAASSRRQRQNTARAGARRTVERPSFGVSA
jgi:capsular polysaccharide biosynthesis protein